MSIKCEVPGFRIRPIEEIIVAAAVVAEMGKMAKGEGHVFEEQLADKLGEAFAWVLGDRHGDEFGKFLEPAMQRLRAQRQ